MSEHPRSRRPLTKALVEEQEQARREAFARERTEAMEIVIALQRVLNEVAEKLTRWRSDRAEFNQAAPPVYIKDEEDWEAWADDCEAEHFYPSWCNHDQ